MTNRLWRQIVRRVARWLLTIAGPAPLDMRVTAGHSGRLLGVGLRYAYFDTYRWQQEVLRHDACAYCGEPGGTVDHIVPKSDGGTDTLNNLTGACQCCNLRKRSMELWRFLMLLDRFRDVQTPRRAKGLKPANWYETELRGMSRQRVAAPVTRGFNRARMR